MRSRHVAFAVTLLVIVSSACAWGTSESEPARTDVATVPRAWQTRAELTDYRETGGYDEVLAFCRKLASASAQVEYRAFGQSAQGRELPLLVLSREGGFRASNVRDHGKVVVLLQNCIHAGECAGKEASLALARDIAITGTRGDLLERVNLLIMPIFNADGHERMGRFNRVNQNGPDAMGWRVTATNRNLNRDYMKADTIEMRYWLRLWNDWKPDLLFDNHTTNGSDHRYSVLYASAIHQDTDPAVAGWLRDSLYPRVLSKMATSGFEVMPYFFLRDRADPAKGVDGPGSFAARFSTGYAGLCNRPSILVEAHALKSFEERVRATYEFMVHTLEELNRDPQSLRSAIAEADARTIATRGGWDAGRLPLRLSRAETSTSLVFKGVRSTQRASEITGDTVIEYSQEALDIPTRYYDAMKVELSVIPPAAYVVPPEWDRLCRRVAAHGVKMFRLKEPHTLTVESYRFTNVTFASKPFEGRQRAKYDISSETRSMTYPAGTFVIPMNQVKAHVAAHLLEPEGPDSLAAWGFFNTIFEQKEYAESYRFEPIARAMLETDDALKKEFEKKLREEAEFAADPRKRLNFLYQRSPYWDEQHNVYPVGRWMDGQALNQLRSEK